MSAFVRALVVALIFQVSVSSQGVKLNEPLVRPIGGDIDDFAVSPDGTRVAYVADQETDEVFEIFCVAADGSGAPVKLNEPLPPDGRVEDFGFSFSPDGAWVVFTIDASAQFRLWSAPADGSFAAVELGPAITHAIAPDSSRVVFLGALPTPGVMELFSVPIDGSAAPVRISAPLPPGGSVAGGEQLCLFSEDGDTVVYLAFQDDPVQLELFAVPTDGSAAPRQLNAPLTPGGDVAGSLTGIPFALGAGDRVVYVADQEVDNRIELFSVPLDGSAAPTKLNGPLVSGGDVGSNIHAPSFVLSADGTRVLYVADEDLNEAHGLYCVPIDGSAPSVALTPGLPSGRAVEQYGFAPDGVYACFLADLRENDRIELFRASVDGSGIARRLSGELVPGGDVERFEITADGRRVVYAADQDSDGTMDLYRVETEGPRRALRIGGPAPGAPVKLSDGILPGSSLDFATTADGAHVVFGGALELYSAPLSSVGPRVLLDTGYQSTLGLTPLQLAGTQRVVYMRGGYTPGAEPLELFSARVDGSAQPVRLNDEMPIGPVLGDVFECDFSPNGDWVVYQADGDTDEVFELYVASVSGRRPTRKLSAGTDVVGWVRTFHPDGQRTLYSARLPGATSGRVPYLARFDGSTPPAVVGGPYPAHCQVSGIGFTPDGTRLVLHGDLDVQGRTELYNAPVDGGAPRFKLNPTLLPHEDVIGASVAPDGQHVLFTIYSGGSSLRLFAVPTDRSHEPIPLSDGAEGEVHQWAFSPDGQFALYLAFSGSFELYAAPVDGSAPAALLSAPTGSGIVAEFVVAPDSGRVVFRDEGTGQSMLRSAPLGGGATATLFSTTGFGSSLSSLIVSPDSASVVFAALVSSSADIYRVPIDGSAAAVPLTGLGEMGRDPHLTADGVHVVYLGTGVGLGWGVFRVPLDGSAPRVRLSPPYTPFVDITLDLTPDGREAVYAVEGPHPDADELYAVPVDGSRPARLLNRPNVDGGVVDAIDGPRFRISPASHAAIYRAARQSVTELYLSLIDSRVSPFGGDLPGIVR